MSNPHRTQAEIPPPPVSYTIDCPSGLVGKIRKMRGAELASLAQASDNAQADGYGAILGPCWLGIEDPGPYSFLKQGDARPEWKRLLKGDLIHLLIALRRISMPDGNNYEFAVKCEECGKRYQWELPLTALPIQTLSEDSAKTLRDGKFFEARIRSSGRRVTFDLMRFEQDDQVEKLMKALEKKRGETRSTTTLVDLLAAQTSSIEGVGPDILNRYDALSALDLDDLYELHRDMQAVDCGVDTAIQTKCTHKKCEWIQDMNLPFGRSFFAPRPPTRGASRGTGSSSGSSGSRPSSSSDSSTGSGGASTGGAATG